MDSRDRGEHEQNDNNEICRLEWIAWAMDAAREYREQRARIGRDPLADDDADED
ncbi:MAG TPA: hypothetical protein VIN61_05905 [Gammaproteobacteria bacterium]